MDRPSPDPACRTARAHRSRRGYTLIEVSVVAIVLGVLATVGVVAFTNLQTSARASAAQMSLRNVATTVVSHTVVTGETFDRSMVATAISEGSGAQVVDGLTADTIRLGYTDESPINGQYAVGFAAPGGTGQDDGGQRAALVTGGGNKVFGQLLYANGDTGPVQELEAGTTPTDLLSDPEATDPSVLPPTKVAASASGTEITVTWTAPAQAEAFTATATNIADTSQRLTCTSSGTTCVIVDADPGATYKVTVTAHYPEGQSATSAPPVDVVVAPLAPDAPTLTVNAATGAYTATWNTPAGATAFIVERRTGSSAAQTDSTDRTTATGTLAYGQTLVMRVRAVAGTSVSAWSAPGSVTRPPAVPATPTLNLDDATGAWTATWPAAEGAASYVLQSRLGTGEWMSTDTTDTALTGTVGRGQTVTVRVKGVTGSTSSDFSGEASATRTPAVPDAPAVAVVYGSGAWTATWPAADGARGYVAQYKVDAGDWQDVAPAATSATGTVGYGQTVIVRVAATAGDTQSAWSATGSATRAPATPVTSISLAADGAWTATWAPAEGAASYQAEYRMDSGGWQTATVNGTSATAAGVVDYGKTVTVRVRAVAGTAVSPWATEKSATRPPAVPGTPSVNLTDATGGWSMSWPAAAGATGYVAEYKLGTGTWTAATVTGTSATATATVAPGQQITVRVKAAAGQTESAWSATASATRTPATPDLSPVTIDQGAGTWTATWTASSGATGYVLESRVDGGAWAPTTLTATTGSGTLGFGQTVTVRVKATIGALASGWSTERSATRAPAVPATPTLSVDDATGTWSMSWPAAAGATGYVAQYRLDADTWTDAPVTGTTATAATTVGYGQLLSVRVKATVTGAESAWSPEATATRAPAVPVTPTVTVDDVTGSWSATWAAATAATGYVAEYQVGDGPWTTATVTGRTATSAAVIGAGQSVRVHVRSTLGATQSAWSPDGSATRTPDVPGAPALALDDATGSWTMTWPPAAGATGYAAQYRLGTGAWTDVTTTAPLTSVRTNLVTNPSLETTTAGWAMGSATGLTVATTRPTSGGAQGAAFAQYAYTGTATSNPYIISGYLPAIGGQTYTGSLYVKTDSVPSVRARLWFYDANTTGVGVVAGTVTALPGGQWTRISVTGVAPEKATQVRLSTYSSGAELSAGSYLAIDGALLETSGQVGTYFDGATAATATHVHLWTGTAHTSASTEMPVVSGGLVARGQQVSVRVQALSGAVASPWSTETTATRAPAVPATPTVTVNDTTGAWSMSWPSATGATGYVAEYKLDTGAWATATVTGTTATGPTAVAPGQLITVHVKATAGTTESTWSADASTTRTPAVPGTPTVSVNDTTGTWSMSWTAASGATGYVAEYKLGTGAWTPATVTGTTATAGASVAYGQLITVHVKATTGAVSSAWSTDATATRAPAVPGTPTVSVNDTTGTWSMSWTAASGATGYVAEYKLGTGAWTPATVTGTTATAGASVAYGQLITVHVKATTGAVSSAWSTDATATRAPAVPSTPTVTVNDTTGAWSMSWTAASGATGYVAEYKLGTGAWTPATVTGTTATVATPVAHGQLITVHVKATTGSATSAWSSDASATRAPAVPGTPTVTVTQSSGAWTMSWTGATGATGYVAEYQIGAGPWTAATVTGTSATAGTSVGYGEQITVHVKATAGSAQSAWSGDATASRAANTPAAPTITVDPATGDWTMSWTAATGATGYVAQYQLDSGSWTAATVTGATATGTDAVGPGSSITGRVQSTVAGVASPWSAQTTVTRAPTVPAPVSVTVDNELGSWAMRWAGGTGATEYVAQYKIGTGAWTSASTDGPLAGARTNLFTNPSAEISTAGFSQGLGGGTATVTQQTTGGYAGTAFRRLTWTAPSTTWSSGPSAGSGSYRVQVEPGATYSGSAYIRVNTAKTVLPRIYFYNASGTQIGSSFGGTSATVSANTWARVQVEGVRAPAGAAQALLAVYLPSGAVWNAGEVIDMDAVLFENSATVGTYFDGWTAPTGATTYAWSGPVEASVSTALPTVSGSVLPYGQSVTVRVKATSGAVESAWSEEVTGIRDIASTDVTLALTDSTGAWTASWSAITGATGYVVEYRTDNGTWTSTSTTATSFNGPTLARGSLLGVHVKVVGAATESGWSLEKQALRSPAVTLKLNADNTVTATWAAPGAASASVDWRIDSGTWATSTTTGTTFTSPAALGAGQTGSVRVTLRNDTVTSAMTTASLTRAPAAPVPSMSLVDSTGAYTVTWPAVPGATSYKVETSTDGAAAVTTTTSGTSSSGTLSRGSTVSVVVYAVNTAGPSAGSTPAVATRLPNAPTATLSLTQSSGAYTVTWPAVAGATSYVAEYQAYDPEVGVPATFVGQPLTVSGASASGTVAFGDGVRVRVAAVNAAGTGAWSTIQAAARIPRDVSPVNVTIGWDTGDTSVAWTAVNGATSYEVSYYRTGYPDGTLDQTPTTVVNVSAPTRSANVGVTARGYTVTAIVVAIGPGGRSSATSANNTRGTAIPDLTLAVTQSTGAWTASWPRTDGVSGTPGSYSRTASYALPTSSSTLNTFSALSESGTLSYGQKLDYQLKAWTYNGFSSPYDASASVTRALPAPTITSATRSGYTANFTWSSVTNASKYRVVATSSGDGGPVVLDQVVTGTSLSVTAWHGATVSLSVYAQNNNADATSPAAGASVTIPVYEPLTLANGWMNYGSGYSTARYTYTSEGVVMLTGLIKGGTTASQTVLTTLPVGYRPSAQLIFQVTQSGTTSARVDVLANGEVRLVSSPDAAGAAAFLSLDTISFRVGGTVKIPTLSNGWTNYGSTFSDLQYTQDSLGRVHVQGLLTTGTITDNLVFATGLPAIDKSPHLSVAGQGTGGVGTAKTSGMGVTSGALIVKAGTQTGWYSAQAMYYAASAPGSWTDATFNATGGWRNYDASFPGLQYRKGADGIVTVRGLIAAGSTAGGTVIATLPAGYRPTTSATVDVTASPNTYARLDIQADGDIAVREGVNNTWLSVEFSLRAEQ